MVAINWLVIKRSLVLALCTVFFLTGDQMAKSALEGNPLEIQNVAVGDQPLHWQPGQELSLGSFPKNIVFGIHVQQDDAAPFRVRCKLESYDKAWDEGGGFMFVMAHFYNQAGDQVAQTMFQVNGSSPGWNGAFESSPFRHRRETLTVPPDIVWVSISISSGGPPSSLGVYAVRELVLSRLSPAVGQPAVLLQPRFVNFTNTASVNQPPDGWTRGGTRPSMAKIVQAGPAAPDQAFAIVDNDVAGHCEWVTARDAAPPVAPGDKLVLEWDEAFSIGTSQKISAIYATLPQGVYQFRLSAVNIYGLPTGAETSLAILVPPPYWKMPWFWAVVTAVLIAISATGIRYVSWRRMQRMMTQLAQQHALEQERVRIAQDIHDDLGARVTQISMLSGMARKNSAFSDKAREEFDNISNVSQELVAALYDTVWAVNPENDNLDAMGNYLCQRINELCTQSQLRCRLHVSPLSREIEISSRVRHSISLAAKESVHNVIKHARASEVVAHITLEKRVLSVSIQDDGCGFDPATAPIGNGLVNIRRRLEDIGGKSVIESSPGKGTIVRLEFAIDSSVEGFPRNGALHKTTAPPDSSVNAD